MKYKKRTSKQALLKNESKRKKHIVTKNTSEKAEKVNSQFGDPLNIKLQCNNTKNSRNSLTRIIRLYSDGKVSHIQFRNLVYAFSHLIAFFKYDVEEEIKKLWETIDEHKTNKE